MKNLNKILILGAGTVLVLSSCSTSQTATRGRETDDLYFMASDVKVATQFAVSNNNPESFKQLNTVNPGEFEQENFSARNVNPEYIAKYQSQTATPNSGEVYFDDNEMQESNPNVNVYNNFYGSGAGVNGAGFNSGLNVNVGFGMGFGAPMWGMGMGWGMPMWGMGMGWGMPMWGMGMGWNSMWGWNMGMGMGMGWGMGGMWGNPWMNPWMGGGMWGNPWMNPWMGGGMWGWGRPGWGMPVWGAPGWGGENGRQVVRGGRPGRDSGMASVGNRPGTNYPSTARSARRDAVSPDRSVGANNRTAGRDFSRSQNDYYNSSRSRVANSAATGSRNVGSAAATRPSNRTGIDNARPTYNSRSNSGVSNGTINRGTASPSFNNRGTTNTNRGANPSYNRGNTINNSRTSTPSRGGSMAAPSRGGSMSTPSRGGSMSAPSRSSSPSFSSPSRSSGGSSMGGASRGGGMSSGGSRGGRGGR
ncbi:hypothetical protein MMU07_17865 [Aquiflexum sp. LQ15W]|uniref:hypothetical protein n=1 Tax=Cognataquiflexum nitidum TaxID=2922272 RepID=UPI001F12F109|nr:hypothetical protein [Cognataquiflexum nitidum]MCH6201453.1 hypothetical protein [Cognataquiflexum nitidum]